jgi:hypothetical protein
MIAPTRRRTWRIAAAAVSTMLVGLLVSAVTAAPAAAHGVVVPGNKTCQALVPNSNELKVEPVASGTYTDGLLTVQVTVRNLTADDPGQAGDQTGSQVFDFTASGAVVLGVAVKGGPDTNFFDYPNGVASATGLHAPVNTNNSKFFGLSHISFCWVPKAKPTITTKVAAAEITIGQSVTDTATLAGGNNPSGTITFRVYGPNDATCTGAVGFTSVVNVSGNGNYTSGAFTPTAVGTFRWVASYSGDVRNEPATTACNDPHEQVVVKKAKPKLTTAPDLLPNDSATIADAFAASGTLTFELFANLTCTGTPVYSQTVTVSGNGVYTTSNTSFRISADASIAWLVGYSGDANNEAATSACTDE